MDRQDGPMMLRRIARVKRCLTRLLVEWLNFIDSFGLSHPTDFGSKRDQTLTIWTDPKSYRLRSFNPFRVQICVIHRASVQDKIMVDHWIKQTLIDGDDSPCNYFYCRRCGPSDGVSYLWWGLHVQAQAWEAVQRSLICAILVFFKKFVGLHSLHEKPMNRKELVPQSCAIELM